MNVDFDYIDPNLLEEDDRIIAYLKGKMTKDEETTFMQDLRNNPELKAKAITTARLVKGMKEIGAQQDKETKDVFLSSTKDDVERAIKVIKSKKGQESFFDMMKRGEAAFSPELFNKDDSFEDGEDSEPAVTITSTESRRKYTILKWMSAAASIIAIVWVGIGYNDYRKTTGLGNEYENAFTNEMIIRGVEEIPSEAQIRLDKLFKDVKNGENLDAAIHDLSLYWELSTMEVYNDYTEYSTDIGWNLAIAYLKDNNKKGAKIVLEKLISINEEDMAIYKKSKELLEKL